MSSFLRTSLTFSFGFFGFSFTFSYCRNDFYVSDISFSQHLKVMENCYFFRLKFIWNEGSWVNSIKNRHLQLNYLLGSIGLLKIRDGDENGSFKRIGVL